jgi:hypothetical protein
MIQIDKALLQRLADEVVRLVSGGMAIELAVARVWRDNKIPDVMYQEARDQASKIIEKGLGFSTIENIGTRQKAWDALVGSDPTVKAQIAKASARARIDLTTEVSKIIKSGEAVRVASVRMQAQAPGDLSAVRKDLKELARNGADPAQIAKLKRTIDIGVKGRALKDAYNRTLKAIESGSQEAIDKQLHYAIQKKVRYNMERVVRTEQARAHFAAQREEIARDAFIEENAGKQNYNAIKYVRFVLAGGHVVDECDAYARADMGYGPGIYPIDQAPVLPIHPNGKSILVPYMRPKKTNAPIVSPAKALTQQAEEMGVRFNGPQLAPIVRKL